ncbi:MAG: hypothetical protein AAGA06_08030 [Pseudomonadota bacterium]
MTAPANGLSPAEAERLAMLAEECGEVIQAVTKILRHGYESFHPNDLFKGHPKPGAKSNRERLEDELDDLRAVLALCEEEADIDLSLDCEILAAIDRKLTYAHHQDGARARAELDHSAEEGAI